ncbi:MAG: PepSY domain-containing protein, partial [Lachnospiraceae bacterium]|nr:PepSY domain-containing protein [Lachnospiraceae bacterium]
MTRLKNLFATPKKAALTITCIIALVALASTITVFAARAYVENTSIGATNAEYYAFADAGVDPEAATNVETEFDYEQGQFIYDVEFYADGTKYDYWIKASDGTVVKKEAKIVNATAAAAAGTEETTLIAEDATVSDMGTAEETTAAAENAGTAQITLEEAKAIALEHAGVDAADATFTKTELDVDNGVSEYDIEFTANGYEYEYEVSVTSGVVLKSEREQVNASANQGTSGETATTAAATITLDEAKVIALNNAGVSASDATFTKGKLDVDDGVTVYDIEFYTTGYEYDYEINATTGAVVKSEKEVRTTTTTKAASEQTTTIQKATEQTTTAAAAQITLAEAKTIALNHAGVSASNATFTEGKLDKDDGVTVYDIEFYIAGYEYEYEI